MALLNTILENPRIQVEIIPYDSSPLTFSSDAGQVLSATTTKVLSQNTGSFTILLAPSGVDVVPGSQSPTSSVSRTTAKSPNTLNMANANADWLSLINLNSLVIIRMGRGAGKDPHGVSRNQTVMVGVVSQVQEGIEWESGSKVVRTIQIQGQDMSYYLTQQSYYTFTGFGILAGFLKGHSHNIGDQNYSPQAAGNVWFNEIMLGSNGLLSPVSFPIPSSNSALGANRTPLANILVSNFQEYVYSDIVPVYLSLYQSEGIWYDKFMNIFPFPLYEFFVNTVPSNIPTQSLENISVTVDKNPTVFGGVPFPVSNYLMNKSGIYDGGYPVVVARTNPNPFLNYDTSSNSWSVNTSYWDQLILYKPDTEGYINTNFQYENSDIGNMFLYTPTLLSTIFGNSVSNIGPLALFFGGFVNFRSLAKYGYRPQQLSPYWFYAPTKTVVTKPVTETINGVTLTASPQFLQNMVSIMAQFASWYNPNPNLMRATVTLPLRPDIIAGNRFEYAPPKVATPQNHSGNYMFYIYGVTHQYTMGGPSTTQLYLSRGLPSFVYNTPQLLTSLLKGELERVDGEFVTPPENTIPVINNSPVPALMYISGPDFTASLTAHTPILDALKTYSTPHTGGTP